MERKRIIFLTTSSGLPRKSALDSVSLNETYVNRIKKRRPDLEVIHIGIPAAPIGELMRIAKYYEEASPFFIVLQSGLVDCAPRALTIFEFEVAKKLKLYRLIKPFTSILRKYRNVYYTKPRDFRDSIEQIKEIFPRSQLITVGILPARSEYETQVPGITERISQFNKILAKNSNFIDNSNFPDNGIASDHHHLTAHGNEILAEKILKRLSEFV